jgi:hypothetical protein
MRTLLTPYRLFWLLMVALILLAAAMGVTLAVGGRPPLGLPDWAIWVIRGLFFFLLVAVAFVACPKCGSRIVLRLRDYGFPPQRNCAACGRNLDAPFASKS